MNPSGLLILDKPPGISSAQAVARVKRLLPKGAKIGHAGTLDPFATGVLLLLVGKATRACEQLMGRRKGYDAVIKLGARTATDDPESPEEPVEVATPPAQAQVLDALAPMIGTIQQAAPVYSALKIQGRRACDIAREGGHVQPKTRAVTIYSIQLTHYAWPLVHLSIECGRGTYIRSIARDLGEKLQTAGYLLELRRTFIGPHRAQDAVTIEQLQKEGVAPFLKDLYPDFRLSTEN